eukprot:GDKH01008929.1.p1 GENE.GDKH01008929.1~~GDKH01008929.1.p1  ORF type:complete len:92 (+),score=20.21 GDKH01008929.1:216-491(+)
MAMTNKKLQKVMTLPINQIFRFLTNGARVQIWLYEQKDMRIEGKLKGFDEYMNIVLEEAEELSMRKKTRRQIGTILLKGENIALIMNTGST